MPERILEGIRVLDFGRYVAAPYCCQILADMGADVIRVDRPGGEPDRKRGPLTASGESLYFAAINRNKKGITLNLASEKGQALLKDLVSHADVLVHNLPAGRAKALGMEYASLQKSNSRLILLALSGFGSKGPFARYSAFDGITQAISGAMSATGAPGTPPTLSHIPYVDFGTGLYGALSVALALFHRERTGKGQAVDLALLGTILSFVTSYSMVAEHAVNGVARSQVGNDFIYGVGGSFPTKDGHIVINSLSDPLWKSVCVTIGRQDLLEDPRLRNDLTRFDNREVIRPAIAAWTSQRTAEEAVAALAEAGVPVGPVLTVDRVAEDARVKAMDIIKMIDQPGIGRLPVAATPMKFSETPGRIDRPAPKVGEHNEEVYRELLGLKPEELQALVRERIL